MVFIVSTFQQENVPHFNGKLYIASIESCTTLNVKLLHTLKVVAIAIAASEPRE